MIEVVVALGVVAFSLVSVLALLPVGVQSNKKSAEETRAANILTVLEADLRNTYPETNFNGHAPGTSQIFGLTLPYQVVSGKVVRKNDSTLSQHSSQTAQIGTELTIGLDSSLLPQTLSQNTRQQFQVTVLYTKVPSADEATPIEARLIVCWPSLLNASASDIVDLSKVQGYIQGYVTFAAP